MLRYLLDTDICIYAMKDRPAGLRETFADHRGAMAVSTVTVFELSYGVERSAERRRNREVLEGFLGRLEVLDFDLAAAVHAAEIRAGLVAAGSPIGAYDLQIAGHARSRGLAVVTNNTREFTRVPGLDVRNWASGG
ncbi:MAG: VapC toxin family PIN domain ribonuclease [Rhodospirillales bacterium CG15_BIG_FIL_POST_REV_8_21_14_020_66_15]|nr:MAG: VapC toxin family PIN domain ribonuclease [Rhodospirillales bacterium CG15_BIG_FIL_POST_REV_8_21_14_020_66_15]